MGVLTLQNVSSQLRVWLCPSLPATTSAPLGTCHPPADPTGRKQRGAIFPTHSVELHATLVFLDQTMRRWVGNLPTLSPQDNPGTPAGHAPPPLGCKAKSIPLCGSGPAHLSSHHSPMGALSPAPRWRTGFEFHSSTALDKWPSSLVPHYSHLKMGM